MKDTIVSQIKLDVENTEGHNEVDLIPPLLVYFQAKKHSNLNANVV